MKRRWFAIAGATVVATEAYLVVEVGIVPGGPTAAALVGFGGLLLLVGGYDPLPDRLAWYRPVGAGVLLFGLAFLLAWTLPALRGPPATADLVLAAAGALNALVLGVVGMDWLRGGGLFDLSAFEPGPLVEGGSGDGEG